MACLGGTPADPHPWVRLTADGAETIRGRICNRANPRTSPRKCASCPAFRGIRRDGTLATGMAPDGEYYGLTPEEHVQYEAAIEARDEDDWEPMTLFDQRMSREIEIIGGKRVVTHFGDRALRAIGDPDALERWAGYMREYRAAHGSGSSTERVRRWRAAQKVKRKPLLTRPPDA